MEYKSIREKFERMIEISKNAERAEGLTEEEVKEWGEQMARRNEPIFDMYDRCRGLSALAAGQKLVK